MDIEKKITIEVHVHPAKASTVEADDQCYRSELIGLIENIEEELNRWAKSREWPRAIDPDNYDKGYYSIKVLVQ